MERVEVISGRVVPEQIHRSAADVGRAGHVHARAVAQAYPIAGGTDLCEPLVPIQWLRRCRPAVSEVCSCRAMGAELGLNGHEWAKRVLEENGMAYAASTTASCRAPNRRVAAKLRVTGIEGHCRVKTTALRRFRGRRETCVEPIPLLERSTSPLAGMLPSTSSSKPAAAISSQPVVMPPF